MSRIYNEPVSLEEVNEVRDIMLEQANTKMIEVIGLLRDVGMEQSELEQWVLETLELY